MAQKQTLTIEPSLPEQLINAAEELYGLYGIEGVSLRQISQHAGTANNYAVQYHFGDVAGLLTAIARHRAPPIEMARARRLKALRAQGPMTTRGLFDALNTPLLDLVNTNGERTLARFNLMLCTTPSAAPYMLDVAPTMPVASEIMTLLQAENAHLSPLLLGERVRLATGMFLNSIFTRYSMLDREDLDLDLIDNALDMASAAICAPVGRYGARIAKIVGSTANDRIPLRRKAEPAADKTKRDKGAAKRKSKGKSRPAK